MLIRPRLVGFAVKSAVWASCQAADAERENAAKRDLFRRCISHTERGSRWLSSFPDQLPGCPGWVRLLTMLLVIVAASAVAMLPGIDVASHLESTDSRAMGAEETHSFSRESVRAIAISLDRGEVTLDVAGVDSTSADVVILVSHSVASTAESSLSALKTSVELEESTGVLAITGMWNGGAEDAFAAPSAALQLTIPQPSLAETLLSVEVQIGAMDAGFGPQSRGDQAPSRPWRGFAAPAGDIVLKGVQAGYGC